MVIGIYVALSVLLAVIYITLDQPWAIYLGGTVYFCYVGSMILACIGLALRTVQRTRNLLILLQLAPRKEGTGNLPARLKKILPPKGSVVPKKRLLEILIWKLLVHVGTFIWNMPDYGRVLLRRQDLVCHAHIFCKGPNCIEKREQACIRGLRFKCTMCENLDFCTDCARQHRGRQGEYHVLSVFRIPELL